MASENSFNFKILVVVDLLWGPHSSAERGFHLESNLSFLLEKVNKSVSKKNSPKAIQFERQEKRSLI